MTHKEQAESNEAVAAKLKADSIGDWMVTAYFYAGLHYINEKIPACRNITSHITREDYLMRINRTDVLKPYKFLSTHSRHARYTPAFAKKFRQSTGSVAPLVEAALAQLKTVLGI